MMNTIRRSVMPLVLVALPVFASLARAGDPRVFASRARGTGVFSPINVGTNDGTGPFVFGDGSGQTPYFATGVGNLFGRHTHSGSIQTVGGGTYLPDSNQIVWPGHQGPNEDAGGEAIHVTTAADGSQIFFTFEGLFYLDLTTGVFLGDAIFTAVGGTGRFMGVSGQVHTIATTSPIDLSLGLPDAAPFDWHWDGVLTLP